MTTRSTIVQLINGGIGRQTQLLYAVPYLHAHIQKYIMHRKAQHLATQWPSISIIHTTHFMPISTSFKPCVIVAFEYVRTCETLKQGCRTEIELKQNCDYISDGYIDVITPEVSCDAVELPDIVVKPFDQDVYSLNGNKSLNFGTGLLNTATQEASGNINVNFGVNYEYDSTLGAYVDTTITNPLDSKQYVIRVAGSGGDLTGGISYTYVDSQGSFIAGPNGQAVTPTTNGFGAGQSARVTRANYVKGADLIGLKYFSRNVFKVDDNCISEYTSMALVNYRERRLGPGVKRAFDRLVGQEVPTEETTENHSVSGGTSSGFPVGNAHTAHARHSVKKLDGLQTPKPVQPPTQLYIPLIHWFNLERKTALPVVCMPDGKLVIQLETSKLNELFYPAPNVYIQETIHAYSVLGGTTGTVANPHLIINRRIPYILPLSKVVEDCCNRSVSLVTCNILLDELIHLMVINRIGFNLITLIREEILSIKGNESDDIKVNQLKWPTEYLHINDQLYSSVDDRLPETAETWWRCGIHKKIDTSQFLHFTRKQQVGIVTNYWKESLQIGCEHSRSIEEIITHLGVNIYDTYFYQKENPRSFYADYLPYAYSNGYIFSDEQYQSMFVTFANIPGPYQPSGFVNLSKTKELFLSVKVNPNVSITNKARLAIESWCRNFLLIADGSCIVRFS